MGMDMDSEKGPAGFTLTHTHTHTHTSAHTHMHAREHHAFRVRSALLINHFETHTVVVLDADEATFRINARPAEQAAVDDADGDGDAHDWRQDDTSMDIP